MSKRTRNNCTLREVDPGLTIVPSSKKFRAVTARQITRVACRSLRPVYEDRLEDGDRAVQDNVGLFFRTFTADRLFGMETAGHIGFDEVAELVPNVYVVSAITHLSFGEIKRFTQANDVVHQLGDFPAHGILEFALSSGPFNNSGNRLDLRASLLQGDDDIPDYPFSDRAIDVVQRTVEEINH